MIRIFWGRFAKHLCRRWIALIWLWMDSFENIARWSISTKEVLIEQDGARFDQRIGVGLTIVSPNSQAKAFKFPNYPSQSYYDHSAISITVHSRGKSERLRNVTQAERHLRNAQMARCLKSNALTAKRLREATALKVRLLNWPMHHDPIRMICGRWSFANWPVVVTKLVILARILATGLRG